MTGHLHDEIDVSGKRLDAAEASDEGDGQETLGVHLSPQEEISLQVVQAKVVLTSKTKSKQNFQLFAHIQYIYLNYIYINLDLTQSVSTCQCSSAKSRYQEEVQKLAYFTHPVPEATRLDYSLLFSSSNLTHVYFCLKVDKKGK